LLGELAEPNASALFMRGMAYAIAIHVARLYADAGASRLSGSVLLL